MSTERKEPGFAAGAITAIVGSVSLQIALAGLGMVLIGVVLDVVRVLGAIMPVILFIWGVGLTVLGLLAYAVIWYNKPT